MDWVKLLTFTKAQLLLRKVKNRRYNLTYHHASQVVNRQYEKWMFRGAGSWPSWLFRLVSCWGYRPGTGCPAQLFVARVGGAFESCRGHHFCDHRSGSCSAPAWAGDTSAFPVTTYPFLVILHLTHGEATVAAAIKHYPADLGSLLWYTLIGFGVTTVWPLGWVWVQGQLQGKEINPVKWLANR